MVDSIKLPKGIRKTDLNYIQHPAAFWDWSEKKKEEWRNNPANILARHDESKNSSFELWEIDGRDGKHFVIPTLEISNSSRKGRRTYATTIDGKDQLMSVGQGPHVVSTHTVYVRESRKDDLMPFLDTEFEGLKAANIYRDRLSSRRAATKNRRMTW